MTSINLIPVEIRQAAARRSRLARWIVATSIAGVLALIPYSWNLSKQAQAAQAQQEIQHLEQEATGLRSQLRLATSKSQDLLSELERSRALRAKRAWSGMFALIARSLPADCWLLSVATDPETPSAAVIRPPIAPVASGAATAAGNPQQKETVTIEAPRKLRLIGYSTNDSQPLSFVSNLMESRTFSRVGLEKTLRAPAGQTAGDETLYQFEIVCEW